MGGVDGKKASMHYRRPLKFVTKFDVHPPLSLPPAGEGVSSLRNSTLQRCSANLRASNGARNGRVIGGGREAKTLGRERERYSVARAR